MPALWMLVLALAPQDGLKLGTYVREVGGLADPTGLVLADDGTTHVLEWALDRVRVFGPEGEELARFGGPGTGDGQLRGARDLALGPQGLLWIADTGNHRVQAWSPAGKFVRSFGTWGPGAGELNAPGGLDVDGERVYVADTLNDRVQVFDHQGHALFHFGSFGAQDGQFNHPLDVAVDPHGDLYVADADNHRIQKFDAAGQHLASWGDFGPHPGFFAAPSGVAFHAGLLFVIDRENHRVQAFDPQGQAAYTWGLHALLPRESGGKLHYPRQLAFAPGGQLAVVAEDQEDRLQYFGPTPAGSEPPAVTMLDRSVATHFGQRAHAVGGLMVMLEPTRPGLRLYDVETDVGGAEPIEITRGGIWGRGFGQVLRPEDAALDPERRWIHVADPAGLKIETWIYERQPGPLGFDPYMLKLAFSQDLREMGRFEPVTMPEGACVFSTEEGPSWIPRWTLEPVALELHPEGYLLAVDARNRSIVQIGSTPEVGGGKPWARLFPLWDGRSWLYPSGEVPDDSAEHLSEPVDLAFSPSGDRLYVVDRLAARVRSLPLRSEEAVFLRPAEGGEHDLLPPAEAPFVRPSGIAVDPAGRVFVSDAHQHQIFVFDAEGRYVRRFGRQGLGSLEFFKPAGITLRNPGQLVILDHGNHRAQIVTSEGEFVHAFGARLFTRPIREELAARARAEAGLPPAAPPADED